MLDKIPRIVMTIMVLFAIMGLVLGVFVAQHWDHKKSVDLSSFHGTVLTQPRSVVAFSLIGMDGVPFDNAQLNDHWTMVFFGFTNCGSICPTTLAQLGKMYRLLENKKANPMPRVVMVSLDPSRDDSAKLAHYVKAFDPHSYAAKGDDATLQLLTKELGIAVAKTTSQRQGVSYENIEHTGTIVLFNPKGQLAAFFTMPHHASLLVNDYLLLVSQERN